MIVIQQDSPNFAVLREYLRSIGFNERLICTRLGIPELTVLLTRRRKSLAPLQDSDELGLLIRLMLLGESLKKEDVEAGLPPATVAALIELELAVPDSADGARLAGSVVLYPVGSLYIVSDRWFAPDGRDYKAPDDIVYPAITSNTAEFMATLPVTPCEYFLELCSGTGAVALAASAYAGRSWAIDITERSTQMAEFNRLLNGVANVTVLKGDLYEGVDEIQFDRIVAHPPYMPVLSRAQIFYDGGADGEQITRRCVEALPRFLKPGGCFYCQAQGSDRAGAPLEKRIRGWLGESHTDFDVAVVEKRAQSPKDAAYVYALKSSTGFESVELMLESLAGLGVESMAYGWIIIQRKKDDRKVFTVRRSAGTRTGPEEIAWLLKWETFAAAAASSGDVAGFQKMIPVARPSLELRTTYRLKAGDLAPEDFTLHIDDPFSMNCKVQPWVSYLIPLCDGKLTVAQLFEACKSHHLIHAETPPVEFCELLSTLISGGFLEVADFRLPDPTGGESGTATAGATLQHQPL
jgi:SAM-dependent methyltransferase